MDAATILADVARTYANLETLAVELLVVSEFDEGDLKNRTEQRARACYAAPDKVRIQEGGSRGMLMVAAGVEFVHCFGYPKRYSRRTVREGTPLPGSFEPHHPMRANAVFLFDRIAERVAEAEVLRTEPHLDTGAANGTYVLSIRYEPTMHPRAGWSSSPVIVWIDAGTNLVSRIEGEVSHRMPSHEDVRTSKVTLHFTRVTINEPISPETFELRPPLGAQDISTPGGQAGGIISVSGSSGGMQTDGNGRVKVEIWNSHAWDNDTLIETCKLKLHGQDLLLERRLTLSEDGKQLRVYESIRAGASDTRRVYQVPVN